MVAPSKLSVCKFPHDDKVCYSVTLEVLGKGQFGPLRINPGHEPQAQLFLLNLPDAINRLVNKAIWSTETSFCLTFQNYLGSGSPAICSPITWISFTDGDIIGLTLATQMSISRNTFDLGNPFRNLFLKYSSFPENIDSLTHLYRFSYDFECDLYLSLLLERDKKEV